MNKSFRLIYIVLTAFSLCCMEHTALAMDEDALQKELNKKSSEELCDIATAIYEGNYRIETIAAAWSIPTNCATHKDIENSTARIKHNIKYGLTEEKRFKTATEMSDDERRHFCMIFATLLYFTDQRVYETCCNDIKYYRSRANALSCAAQLSDILQDFELFSALHQKASVEDDRLLADKCREFELKIRNLIISYRAEYETIRTYYEAIVKKLKENAHQNPHLREFIFNSYFYMQLLTPCLHQEQIIPNPVFHTDKPAALEDTDEQPALSQQEINDQVNALMKQLEPSSTVSTPKPQKKKKKITAEKKQKKLAKQLLKTSAPRDVYEEYGAPTIASMSQTAFGKLEPMDRTSHLFEYQEYWFKRIAQEQANPPALMRFAQKLYQDHAKHKRVFDWIFFLNYKGDSEEKLGELLHMQQLITHAIRCHNEAMSEHDNQEKILAIAKQYEAYTANVAAEMQELEKVFGQKNT